MSRAEKPTRTNTLIQLRKNLGEGVKVLQNVTSSLEKIETSFADSESALSNERTLRERISGLEKEVAVLREENGAIESQRQEEIASFADTTLKLTQEYGARSSQIGQRYDLNLQKMQHKFDIQEQSWQQKVEDEKTNTNHAKTSQSQSRREVENRLQKANEDHEKKQNKLETALQDNKRQVAELQKINQVLTHELNNNETILKGHETEIQKHKGKIAALETFTAEESTDKPATTIGELQQRVREFCIYCIDTAEMFPTWNRFPDHIRNENLPKVYLSESDAGRCILAAAVQDSICAALTKSIFVPFGPCASQESRDIANALYQDNPSHEAIWRLMTVNVILQDQKILNPSNTKLQGIADSLLASWDPFPGKQQRIEVRNMMIQLLVDSASVWLELMRFRSRIQVSVDVDSQYFDSDSEEESYNIPGDLKLPDATHPVLCLFPAFFWNTTPDATARPKLIRKGTAMFRDSPPLLVALKEELEVPSPRISHRKPTTM